MLAHLSSEFTLQLFPLECLNFQEPHKIPTTSKAAAPPATTPPRKDPATVAPADSAAVIDSPVRTSYNMEQRLNTLMYKTSSLIIRIEYCTTLEKGLNNYLYHLDSFHALTSTCIAHLHPSPLAVRTLLSIWSDASYPHIVGLA